MIISERKLVVADSNGNTLALVSVDSSSKQLHIESCSEFFSAESSMELAEAILCLAKELSTETVAEKPKIRRKRRVMPVEHAAETSVEIKPEATVSPVQEVTQETTAEDDVMDIFADAAAVSSDVIPSGFCSPIEEAQASPLADKVRDSLGKGNIAPTRTAYVCEHCKKMVPKDIAEKAIASGEPILHPKCVQYYKEN